MCFQLLKTSVRIYRSFFSGVKKETQIKGEKETQGERNLLTLVISYLLLVTRDGPVQGIVWL
jgi:hypothetical protein